MSNWRELRPDEQHRTMQAVDSLSSFIRAQIDRPIPQDYINWRVLNGDISVIASALAVLGGIPSTSNQPDAPTAPALPDGQGAVG